MAVLKADARRRIPKSQMGVPGKATASGGAVSGTFPMPDKAHARSALSLIRYASDAEKPRIRAKANAMLGRRVPKR